MIAITVLIGGLVVAGISYPGMADAKGWPRGEWSYSNNWSIFYGIGGLMILWAGWKYGGFTGVAVAFIASWIVGFILTGLFGRNIQMISIMLAPLALPWWIASFFLN